MKRFLLCGVCLLFIVLPLRADPAAAKIVQNAWDAAYLEGAKAGYFHTLVQEIDQAGRKVYRTTLTMNMAIKRYNAVVPLRMEIGSEETADGKVLGLSLTQVLDKGRMVQTARVEEGKLLFQSGESEAKTLPWQDDVVGPYYAERLFQIKKVKPGDKFDYRNYELSLLRSVVVHVDVKGEEEIDLLQPAKKGGKLVLVKRKLLRAESKSDKVEINGVNVPLPRMVHWLNDQREIARSEMELPGLGKVALYRTSRAIAQVEGAAPALMPDLGLSTLIPLNRRINRPHDARTVTYRITIQGDDDPGTAFAQDARQTVRKVEGNTLELLVKAVKKPAAKENPAAADPEFLKSSYFLDSKDERVRELARTAVDRETDPLKKARLIEKWVHANMQSSSSIGFATAGQIARDLEGDCRQHAMLAAGMCRAAGVAARTAIGLVYVDDPQRGPVLGFHMWTEVWIDGQWLGLDATLGQGGIGSGHLKISSPSWNDTQTLAPLLQVTRVIGKMKAEIVRVTVPKKTN